MRVSMRLIRTTSVCLELAAQRAWFMLQFTP
jgi:hypothetical protein